MPEHIWKEHRHGVRCEQCGAVTQKAHQLWPCEGGLEVFQGVAESLPVHSEKDRRVYYQNLVYEVCRLIDVANGNLPGKGIVCGTVDEPSTQLQQAVTVLIQKTLNGTSSEAMKILSHVSRTLRLAIPDQSQTCLEALAAMVVKQRDDAMEELKALRAIVEPLNRLRAEEGSSVEILCDNPEGPPNCAIRVFSDWGGVHWEQRRFDGNTLAECLKAAEDAKAAAERQAAQ